MKWKAILSIAIICIVGSIFATNLANGFDETNEAMAFMIRNIRNTVDAVGATVAVLILVLG